MMEELDKTANVDVMYVAEMDPPTADGCLVYDIGDDVLEDNQLTEVKVGPAQTKSRTFTFHKLDPNVETYSVIIRTLVNGRTIVSVSLKVFSLYRPDMHFIRAQKKCLSPQGPARKVAEACQSSERN